MAKVTITLEADLALEVMMRLGVSSPQDAVELVVRDFLATGRRTEARTGGSREGERFAGPAPSVEEG
ncbi:hypothetical protein [Kitasatospora cheerisanensis]|uniref:DUF2191 domain-containing protein n=1 Tax=Kitasatospora cheerisanensis KCTC 2395 TaxID=1348663 RepID=A0A066YY41_9ACTN|nr:hypothetical protein [Kitasatospora cheerisanensis]KDN86463.1 hypothetical protein KCH_17640 [Kitasatospora cheerisanensis KCTC 2395]